MDTNSKHLNDQQIQSLMDEYYCGNNVKDLIKKYNLECSASNLYKLFPPLTFSEYQCEYCGDSLVADRRSKTMQKYQIRKSELYCPRCNHYQFTKCNCGSCKDKEKKRIEDRIEKIKEEYDIELNEVSFSELPFRTKIYLGVICREILSEDTYLIFPSCDAQFNIAPSEEILKQIYNDLYVNDAITVSANSSIEAFENDEEKFPSVFYI